MRSTANWLRKSLLALVLVVASTAAAPAQEGGPFLLYLDFGIFDICITDCPDGAGHSEFCCEVVVN